MDYKKVDSWVVMLAFLLVVKSVASMDFHFSVDSVVNFVEK